VLCVFFYRYIAVLIILRSGPYDGNYNIFLLSVITTLYYVCSDSNLIAENCYSTVPLYRHHNHLDAKERNKSSTTYNRKLQLVNC
jgi:hypothetical protein